MQTTATLLGVRLSAQKGRLVADQIRGLSVDKALNLLAFSPKKGARILKKVLESAIANAEHNEGADIDELKITTIYVDNATTRKRLTARAGVVIGKKGEDIETLRGDLRKMMGGDVGLNIEEIRKPEIDAQLISDSIAQQLEKRIMFRRAMKRAMQNAMRLGAQGIKIM